MDDSIASLLRTGQARWRLALLNGPNMSNLGKRDTGSFGGMKSLGDLEARVARLGASLGVQIVSFSSNHEGDFLDWIHENADEIDGIIINPAGLTEYGLASRHAIRDTGKPTIEVHFANIKRHRHRSIFTKHVVGVVHGLRKHSYTAALIAMVAMLDDQDFERPELYRPRAIAPPSV